MGASGFNAIQSSFVSCEECGGGHAIDSCPGNQESVQFVANYNRQPNDSYSNVYNLGWRNHPNFSWKQNEDQTSQLKPAFPPGFQSQPQQVQPQVKKPSMEEIMLQYMTKTDSLMQNEQNMLQNQQNQL